SRRRFLTAAAAFPSSRSVASWKSRSASSAEIRSPAEARSRMSRTPAEPPTPGAGGAARTAPSGARLTSTLAYRDERNAGERRQVRRWDQAARGGAPIELGQPLLVRLLQVVVQVLAQVLGQDLAREPRAARGRLDHRGEVILAV